jgi:phosphoglycerate dehydrogenase-like enzyme
MSRTRVLVLAWLPEGCFEHLRSGFPDCDWIDGRDPGVRDQSLGEADVTYGLPLLEQLHDASHLRWIQLTSAGVPGELCALARQRGLRVTNLAGLYGPTIAEHAIGLLLLLTRNFLTVQRNQQAHRWDRSVMSAVVDLHRRTLAIIGLGNIGRAVARLGRAIGMRVVGCRRTPQPTPDVDQVYPYTELPALLSEADAVVVAAPLTPLTHGLLGPEAFTALKKGAFYVNVSRGGIAQEAALLDALRTGQVAAAGLDVFAVEPLPTEHPLWDLPQVFISPHYSGETVNSSMLPAERFRRNLANWLAGRPLEGLVDLEQGY